MGSDINKADEASTTEKSKEDSVGDKDGDKVEFKVVFNKKKFDITFGLDDTVGALKVHLSDIISVPNTMQKIMIKGLAKDEMTLRKLGVVKKPTTQQPKEAAETETAKEAWSEQKQHKKV